MATANREIHRVKPEAHEREQLRASVRKGRTAGWKLKRALAS